MFGDQQRYGPIHSVPPVRLSREYVRPRPIDLDFAKMLANTQAEQEKADASSAKPGDAVDASVGELLIGLDLGKSQDYSALCIIQRLGQPPAWQYQVRYLHRWPLQTGYPAIIADLGKLVRKLPAPPKPPDEPCRTTDPKIVVDGKLVDDRSNVFRPSVTLCVDVTGVGLGVFDFLREAKLPCRHYPILIVAGRTTSTDERKIHHVPKIELVSSVNKVLSSQRLQVAKLPLAPTLRRELGHFTVKVSATTGNETYEAWRERDHDDMVLSVAMAIYCGERTRRTAHIWMG